MKQSITTDQWTKITGLDGSKNYVLQALYESNSYQGMGVSGSIPIAVMWLQQNATPAETDKGVISEQIKVSGATFVYVKSPSKPDIIIQEVVE